MSRRYAMSMEELEELARDTNKDLTKLLQVALDANQATQEQRSMTIGLLLEKAIAQLSLDELLERRQKLQEAIDKIDEVLSQRTGARGTALARTLEAIEDPVQWCIGKRIITPDQLGTHGVPVALVREVREMFQAKRLPELDYRPPSANEILVALKGFGTDITAVKHYVFKLMIDCTVQLAPFLPKNASQEPR